MQHCSYFGCPLVVANDLGNREWARTGANETYDRALVTDKLVYVTPYNTYDSPSNWDGIETNSFLVGMESYHHSGYEDRSYQYFYQNSENWILTDCHKNQTTNKKYDGDVNYPLLPDQVIAGNR